MKFAKSVHNKTMVKDIFVLPAPSTLEMYMWSKKKRPRLITKKKLPLASSAMSASIKRRIIVLKMKKWNTFQGQIFAKSVKHDMMMMMCANLNIMMSVVTDVKSLILLLAKKDKGVLAVLPWSFHVKRLHHPL